MILYTRPDLASSRTNVQRGIYPLPMTSTRVYTYPYTPPLKGQIQNLRRFKVNVGASPINHVEIPDLDDAKEQERLIEDPPNNMKAQRSNKDTISSKKDSKLLKGKHFWWNKCERTQLSAYFSHPT